MPVEIDLPEAHAGQQRAFDMPGRFKAIRCGRRWGKTVFGEIIACDAAIGENGAGENVGYFTPTYKLQSEVFNDIASILKPIRSASSKVEGVIRTTTGGRIDFWTLENEDAGRSRSYHKVIIDEAAFTKPNMIDIWERSIQPTLLDFQGQAYVLSNTNGADPDNFLYQICKDPKHGFIEYHAPTHDNPHVPRRKWREPEAEYQARRAAEFEAIKARRHPLVYQQEYLAEFVSWAGAPIFAVEKLLENGQPVAYPTVCDSVFAIIDTAVKGGKEHDGTAVSYWAHSSFGKYPLICLDWDVVQIDAALLEHWIPGVFRRGEELAKQCRARYGWTGVNIEDINSGAILLQQCVGRGFPAVALPSTLAAAGKDARAINASNPVFRGEVKLSDAAYNKNDVEFKGAIRNHMVSQVTTFRIGDKEAYKRADDLLDTFTYAVAITLGDSEGIA